MSHVHDVTRCRTCGIVDPHGLANVPHYALDERYLPLDCRECQDPTRLDALGSNLASELRRWLEIGPPS